MANEPKSLPEFAFGVTSSSGAPSKGLFGQATSTPLFGSGTTVPSTSGSNIFGDTSAASGFGMTAASTASSNLFGGTNTTSNATPSASSSNLFGGGSTDTGAVSTTSGSKLFGGTNATSGASPSTSISSLFGRTNTPSGAMTSASNSNLFGGNTTTSGAGTPTTQPPSIFGNMNIGNSSGGVEKSSFGGFSSAQPAASNTQATNTGGPFSGFSTPNKSGDMSAAGQGQKQNLLGTGPTTGGSNMFTNPASNASGSGQAGALTPVASKPGVSFGTLSTTPAGPPPSTNLATGLGGSAFSMVKPQEQKNNLFGNQNTTQSTAPGSGSTTVSSNPFGSLGQSTSTGLLGTENDKELATKGTSKNPFGKLSGPPGSNAFGNLAGSQSTKGFFSNPNKAAENTSAGPNSTTATTVPASQGQTTPASGSNGQNPSESNTPKQPFSFLNSSSTTATNAGAPLSNLNAPSTSSGTTESITTLTAPSLFAGLTVPGTLGQQSNSATNAPKTLTPSISSPFGGSNKTTGPSAMSASATRPTLGTTTGTSNTNGAASTSGPLPPALSRLKNKSMDEIITRWASDLSKYQKEFQKQAEKVAAWDRMLVENSDKIQKLYGNTLEAERATSEVERQLSAVENDQAELSHWLDHYEAEVDQMIANQIGPGESLQGPDQERERTYKLAEKLSDRLDEMGKDLTGMIEEINDASSTLSKNSNTDDPLSQIVRVLNSHLSQLQQIDQGAAALQAKVAAAQKLERSVGLTNGFNGSTSDAADDFYRSFMGRRRN